MDEWSRCARWTEVVQIGRCSGITRKAEIVLMSRRGWWGDGNGMRSRVILCGRVTRTDWSCDDRNERRERGSRLDRFV